MGANKKGNQSNKEYLVTYSQNMGNRYIKVGIVRKYIVKSQLSFKEMQSVAFTIFFKVSYQFESFQKNFLFRRLTKSSFSA